MPSASVDGVLCPPILPSCGSATRGCQTRVRYGPLEGRRRRRVARRRTGCGSVADLCAGSVVGAGAGCRWRRREGRWSGRCCGSGPTSCRRSSTTSDAHGHGSLPTPAYRSSRNRSSRCEPQRPVVGPRDVSPTLGRARGAGRARDVSSEASPFAARHVAGQPPTTTSSPTPPGTRAVELRCLRPSSAHAPRAASFRADRIRPLRGG